MKFAEGDGGQVLLITESIGYSYVKHFGRWQSRSHYSTTICRGGYSLVCRFELQGVYGPAWLAARAAYDLKADHAIQNILRDKLFGPHAMSSSQALLLLHDCLAKMSCPPPPPPPES
eukprot:4609841-Amphidinium_carterae.1